MSRLRCASPTVHGLPHVLLSPMRTLIIPGWRNSGPGHWQSQWETQLPDVQRVQQDDWIQPRRTAWVGATTQAILARPDPVLLVAHSLGCIVVSHLPPEAMARVHAALLVAPADPERRAVLVDFAPVPHARLPFRSTLVASTNDPYCPVRLAGAYARAWGSQLVRVPDAGHINVESGHGDWPQGLALLRALAGAEVPLHAAA
jgi:predicted alpha/beta hydrolase family esterase